MHMMRTMEYCITWGNQVHGKMLPLVDDMPARGSFEGWAFRIPVGGGNMVSVAVPPDKNTNNLFRFETVETLVFDDSGKSVGEPETFNTKGDLINLLVKYVATLRKHYGWTPP